YTPRKGDPEMNPFTTREEWLEAAVEELRPAFTRAGYEIPALRVSVDRPAMSKNGQCHARSAAEDGRNHIFVSSALSAPVDVLKTLAHELAHAVDDCEHGHRAPFRRIATAVGLTGPSYVRSAWSEEGRVNAERIASALGAYPHRKLERPKPK